MAEKKGSEEELIRSLEIPANIPLYVSIDKDVLCQEEAGHYLEPGGYDFRRDAESTSGIVLSFEKRMEKSCRWISAGNVIRIRVWKVLKMIMQQGTFMVLEKWFEWRE